MTEQNNSLIITRDDWNKLAGSFSKDGLPLPFVQEIFLIQCHVAGTTHVQDIKQKTQAIDVGTILAFKREPQNQFDDKAILILNQENQKIGYVPRDANEILANLMDAGKLIFGKVQDKQLQGNWINISIQVFLRDL